MRLMTVVINTTNTRQLAEFWASILEVEIAMAVPGDFFIWLQPQYKGGVGMAFQQVDENPLPDSERFHVDLRVPDRAAAAARIIELGGSFVQENSFDEFAWSIMADPEGNRFCIAEEH